MAMVFPWYFHGISVVSPAAQQSSRCASDSSIFWTKVVTFFEGCGCSTPSSRREGLGSSGKLRDSVDLGTGWLFMRSGHVYGSTGFFRKGYWKILHDFHRCWLAFKCSKIEEYHRRKLRSQTSDNRWTAEKEVGRVREEERRSEKRKR